MSLKKNKMAESVSAESASLLESACLYMFASLDVSVHQSVSVQRVSVCISLCVSSVRVHVCFSPSVRVVENQDGGNSR